MTKLEETLQLAIAKSLKDKFNIEVEANSIVIEIPKDSVNGDYSTNIAMKMAKKVGKNPLDIANELTSSLTSELNNVKKIEVARPGFINFWMNKESIANIINTVIDQDESYGLSKEKKKIKILEEYVSANPTGPLHCGHARGAAWGDSCVRIMKAAGYDVTREYYINDAGAQIHNLGLSVYARYKELFGEKEELPDDGYHGKDVAEDAKTIKEKYGDKFLKMNKEEAVEELSNIEKQIKLDIIKKDLDYYGCGFDSWISEKWLYEQGMVDDVIKKMNDKNLLYEQDNALFFKTTQFGDDKDRVLKKSDGLYTYLTPDIANHLHKFDRGYDLLINIWGADHHGYIPRMKAAMQALGHNPDNLEVDICQMVRMVENGEEVKMSKRTGNAITIRELIDDIGVDCTRYFFLSKALDTHLDFDLSLARKKTNENPVYYIQYAYARISSILKQAEGFKKQDTYTLLNNQKEIDLLKHISLFGEVIDTAAKERAPHRVCNYVHKLASYFHAYYAECMINDPNNKELTNERLALIKATQITIKNALALLGVSTPEKM